MTSQVSPSTVAANATMEDKAEDGPTGPDPNRWFFERERLETTPSRKCGIDPDKELTYRQQSANFIQDMGQRLQVNQLCINTAIVYMHRFYMYHSFTQFHRNHVSTASIFLAAKVEEQPRKLEHVIKVAHYCLNRDSPPIDTKSENYAEQTSELVMTENILLQTLGFDISIDHPHTHVVKCCQLVRASKDLAQTSYFMATNSLHLTTMCLQYKPTVVACVCIHLTCKWSNWEIPRSKEGKDWFWYVDDTVTKEQLEKLTTEFLAIFDKSPSRLKKKILSLNQSGGGGSSLALFPTLGVDPNSPGAPSRSHSPATMAGTSTTLGKRPNSAAKPGGSQISNKQPKVNGGIGHHPMKPHPGSQGLPSNNSSKHLHYTGNKGVPPPGTHHGAKDAHNMPHMKPQGHHSNHPQAYSHGSSNRPSSSHSHPSGFHSQSHGPQQGQQPPKPPTSHPASGQQHPLKPPHQQPSKVSHSYNTKSQPPAAGQHSSSKPLGSSSTSQTTGNSSINKMPPPPPLFNQTKKPYHENSTRRENPADFNGKRENSDDSTRRPVVNSQSQPSRPRLVDNKPVDAFGSGGNAGNLPSTSLPTTTTATTEPSKNWVDNSSASSEPRIPPGRTSLFSPDPELMESANFLSSSIQSIVRAELSPIGDSGIGAKEGNSNSDTFTMPSVPSSTVFPNLFEFGLGGRGTSNDVGGSETKTVVGTVPLEEKPELPISSLPHVLATNSLTSVVTSGNLLAPKSDATVTSPSKLMLIDGVDGESPPKKAKKSKKEKHKHKDKDKERHEDKKDKKDKEEKKHKDKNKDKSKDEKDKKRKEKHKKEKHKEKDKLKIKHPNQMENTVHGFADPSANKIKISLSSKIIDNTPISTDKQKSKHSSKKHSSKSNTASESSSTPSIKLKIVPLPPRPPTDDKLAFTSKQN